MRQRDARRCGVYRLLRTRATRCTFNFRMSSPTARIWASISAIYLGFAADVLLFGCFWGKESQGPGVAQERFSRGGRECRGHSAASMRLDRARPSPPSRSHRSSDACADSRLSTTLSTWIWRKRGRMTATGCRHVSASYSCAHRLNMQFGLIRAARHRGAASAKRVERAGVRFERNGSCRQL